MSNISLQMPKYKCYKEVWALKIKGFVRTNGNWNMIPEDNNYSPIEVSADWVEKHHPYSGGYYVVYEDGYKSFSPASAFESGYERIN